MMDRSREERRKDADRPAWISFDEGKTWHHAAVARHKPWRNEILLIVALFFIAVGAGFYRVQDVAGQAKMAADDANIALEKVESFASGLRGSAVRGCQRQNRVRQQQHVIQRILRHQLRDEIRQNQTLEPSDFPGFTPREFRALVAADIKRNRGYRRELAHILPLAPCEQAYPKPSE